MGDIFGKHDPAVEDGTFKEIEDELLTVSCECCGKETDANGDEVEKWVSIACDDNVEVLVCDDCAGYDKHLKEALDVFIEEYRNATAKTDPG